MKLTWAKALIIPLFLLAACSKGREFDEKYYAKENSALWMEYVNAIGIPIESMAGNVLIVANSTACGPCINEIRYWDLAQDDLDTDIFLILVDKYSGSYRSFLSNLDIELPAFQDSAGLIFEYELIPPPPVKIFFNAEGDVEMIYPAGAGGRKEHFLEQINRELQ